MKFRYLTWSQFRTDNLKMSEWKETDRETALDLIESPFWQTIDIKNDDAAEGEFIRCTRTARNGRKYWYAAVPDKYKKFYLQELYQFFPERGESAPNFDELYKFYTGEVH